MQKAAKRKWRIIVGCVAAGLIVVAGLCILLALGDDSALSADEIAQYNELAATRADFTGSLIKTVPIEEFTPLVDGVDYSSAAVKDAFADLYNIAESVRKHTENSGNASRQHVSGPRIWVNLGAAVVGYIEKQQSASVGSELYAEWSEPGFWIEAGDAVIVSIDEQLNDTGEAFDVGAWSEFIGGIVVEYAEEEDSATDWSALNDVVAECMDEQWVGLEDGDWVEYTEEYFDASWEEYRENPTEETYAEAAKKIDPMHDAWGRIKAAYYPVQYKATGKLFYRETLSEKQRLLYDIAVTVVQEGKLEMECDFGIADTDEMLPALEAVMRDFPEFFFLEGIAAGSTFELHLVPSEEITQIGIDQAIAQIAERVKPIVAAANKISAPIDKVKYIADYICEVDTYHSLNWETDSLDAVRAIINERQTIWSGIVTNDTVCAGYAAAFHYYMNLVGISATRMLSSGHAWNLLELDGDYYYMDVTWLDGGGYQWFNFNENLLKKYMADENTNTLVHGRDHYSAMLPAAKGTKYSYDNWYGTNENTTTTATATVTRTRTEPQSAAPPVVVINGVDVSSELRTKEIDGVLYAESKSFIESFSETDMSGSMHYFNYALLNDNDVIASYFASNDAYSRFRGCDAILVSSWFTDSAVYMLFLGRTEVVVFGEEEYAQQTIKISETPQIVNGEVYIPMDAFANMTGNRISIQ
ncbi:MAG: hypothetical protein LBS96_05655 [Oscillospiraceae bacterium]|jgi:hypothetical protein|nr:hypothetical protein [Oscillospiraceae bacterium]